MARPVSPIDITPPGRYNSSSPRTQTSNLTFALQEAGANDYQPNEMSMGTAANETGRLGVGGHRDSISNGHGSYYGAGARPIAMKDRPRRESNTGSFVNGMSWGGVSVGSWIRDDIMMSGTSPAAFNQSPSFHSSSYLPKMEANFMKDFTCCGLTLDSLHDLLQHFEEAHAQGPPPPQRNPSITGVASASRPGPSSGMVPTTQAPTSHADLATNTQHGFKAAQSTQSSQGSSMNSFAYKQQRRGSEGFNRTNLSTVQDMDSLEDMEMDDVNPLSPIGEHEPFSPQQQQAFGQGNAQIPQLNINVANTLGNQVRNSTPNTPLATSQSFGFQNNPTVSSVNTPTLGTQSVQQQQRTPDSSVPGTPAELDPEFAMNFMGGLNMPMGNQMMQDGNMNFNLGFSGLGGYDGTIDQPAKRLFSKTGPSGLTQAQLALALRQNQTGGDSELAKRLREQAILANAAGIPFQEENKPFRCPVIGCEKAYKNQNGLKYHKQHGHQNQQLKENEDGTFSIVDPVTSIPYPGTVGMEKEKPYRCEVCGKRYKNLNGLKYHRQHSAPCNPELKLNNLNLANLQNLQGLNMNANVAGAGLAGMGDANMGF